MPTNHTKPADRSRWRNPTPLASRAPDAARRLGLSTSGVYNLIRQGRITGIRIGRAVLIRETELERFLADHEMRGGR